MQRLPITVLALAGLLLGGCDVDDKTEPPSKKEVASTAPAWILASAPQGDVPVSTAKTSAKEGDNVIVRGRIGGRVEPMSGELATFIMTDMALKHCAQIEGDTCSTPWDYCCEPTESMVANTATVQIVDEAGEVRELNLADYGFKPLDEVVVVGKIGPRPSLQALVIEADRICRVGG